MDGELLAEYAQGQTPVLPTKEYGYRNGELLIVAEAPTSYELVARHSGRCADVVNMWTHNGAPLVQYDCSGTANQHFRIEPVGGGYYRIVAEHSNKALDIEGVSYQGGARVTQWEYVGGANQQWSIEATDSGYVRLIARHSGKAMEIAGGPGATQNGAELIQWGWWGGSSQQWQLRGVGNSNTVKWLVNDHLGTPRMIADGTGSLAGITRKDYLPYGEELTTQGGRTTSQGYRSDSTRQGFTGYEHDAETNLEFAQARYYASVQGRFTSVDPLLASGITVNPKTRNRYAYALNNPMRFTDPSGMIAGDFYNQDGNRLGTDGINDGKIYVVPNKNQAKQIEQTNKRGGTTAVSAVGSAILLPSLAVRQAIGAAVDRSNKPTADDKKGGFHEEGLIAGPTVADGQERVVNAAPGAFSDLSLPANRRAAVNLGVFANPAEAGILADITVTAHVHPKGSLVLAPENAPDTVFSRGSGPTTRTYDQPPSVVDRNYAATIPNATHIVAGARNNTAYIYNGAGGRATFPLDKFVSIGGRK